MNAGPDPARARKSRTTLSDLDRLVSFHPASFSSIAELACADGVRDREERASTHMKLVRQVNINRAPATPGIAWTQERRRLAPELADDKRSPLERQGTYRLHQRQGALP